MPKLKIPKIEKGIPVGYKRTIGKPRGQPERYPFRSMKVGDSFFVKCSDPEVRRTNLLNAACHLRHWRPETHGNFRITTSIEPGGVRAWRIA